MEIVFFIMICFLILLLFSVAARPWEDWKTGLPDRNWQGGAAASASVAPTTPRGPKVQPAKDTVRPNGGRWPAMRDGRVPVPVEDAQSEEKHTDL